MSAISLLRARTSAAHEIVDAAFGAHDLTDHESYRRFLLAHAAALPWAEGAASAVWPRLRYRTPLLQQDLAELGMPLDLRVSADPSIGPENWGTLYVVEGSRLGGGMLARSVGAGLPRAYLSATHESGEWRQIRSAIDGAASGKNTAWHEEMVAGALATFARYAAS